jgi:cytochrome c553
MKNFKLSLSQEDIQNLAAYFAVQQRKPSPLNATRASKPRQALLTRCVGCHGTDGNSTNPDMPSLSGQNSAYLLKALLHYRDGERREPMMKSVTKGLSDATVEQLANYFATRKPMASSTATVAKTGGSHFDPMGDGKKIAGSCNACHGDKGNSRIPGTPRLSGQHETYLRDAIAAYQGGHRQHVMMSTLTKHLSQTDIEKVSLYYASQTPAPDTGKADAKKVAQGKELASGCAGCHGEDGNSKDEAIPSLAGQNSAYLMAAITAYKDKRRDNSDMQGAVEELDAKAIKALAQYYAQLAPKAGPVHIMEAPEVLAQKCNRCHGEDGRHPDADTKPRIAGQRQSYMVQALLAYKTGERPSNLMDAMAGDLALTEIEAIAAYYAKK